MSLVGPLRQLGLVVHPVREIGQVLADIESWARARDIALVQLRVPGQTRVVAPAGDAGDCNLIVAVGGDGTVLAAIRAGAAVDRPVLGVACGSLGALATVSLDEIHSALDRFQAGDWTPAEVPALRVGPHPDEHRPGGTAHLAFNDAVVVRAGAGQVAITVHVDGSLYGAFAGDGVLAATPLGSSAYALAAGGPLLLAGVQAYVVAPLAAHGGRLPAVVLGAQSRVRIDVDPSHVGVRVELDGQATEMGALTLELALLGDQATLVRFGDEEAHLTGLRRRRILLDSPRMDLRDARMPSAPIRAQAGPAPEV
jgi:NAD+ kinase